MIDRAVSLHNIIVITIIATLAMCSGFSSGTPLTPRFDTWSAVLNSYRPVSYPQRTCGPPKVKINSGWLHGRQVFNEEGLVHEEYLNVPFALVQKRFQKAIYPHPLWRKPLDATEVRLQCWRKPFGFPIPDFPNEEQCLVLYVYVPSTVRCNRQRLAVALFIHGGGYETGNAPELPGTELVEVVDDVIHVAISYRLGIWGFLHMGDQRVAPENLGLWDQHLGIRWVHDNIHKFGGDPSKVTLWGPSAGGGSVALQMLFPGNKGLFRRVISTGTTATLPYHGEPSCSRKKRLRQMGENVAMALGCPTSPPGDMVECLSSVPNEALLNVSWAREHVFGECVYHRFGPVIDGVFIKDIAYESFKSGITEGIDFMQGHGLSEGAEFLYSAWVADRDPFIHTREDLWRYYFYFLDNAKEGTLEKVSAYYGTDVANLDPLSELADKIYTERRLATPHHMAATYHYKFTNVTNNFYYVMEYLPSYSFLRGKGNFGATHEDAIQFAYGEAVQHRRVYGLSQQEVELSRQMVKMHMNFVKYGDPSEGDATDFPRIPQWVPHTKPVLMIKCPTEESYIATDYMHGADEFWEETVYPKKTVDPETLCREP